VQSHRRSSDYSSTLQGIMCIHPIIIYYDVHWYGRLTSLVHSCDNERQSTCRNRIRSTWCHRTSADLWNKQGSQHTTQQTAYVTPFGELLLLAGPQPTTRYITQPTIPLPSYSVLSVMDAKRRTKSCADVGIFMFNMRQCWRLDPSP